MPTLTIENQLSPRIITVDAPDTEITVQEVVDLLRDWEDTSLQGDDDQIVRAVGKSALEGGVFTGITATLLNAQLQFAPRAVAISTGNVVSTASADGRLVICSGSTFVTDGVSRGDTVVNTSDANSHATIVAVEEEQLTVLPPLGGIEDDYDVSDVIVVFKDELCTVSGGNLVAVDENDTPIDAIFPSFGTYAKVANSTDGVLVSAEEMAERITHIWQDLGFDPNNPKSVDTAAGTVSVAGTVRQWVGTIVKTLTRTT